MRNKLLFALTAIVLVASSCSKSGKTDLLVPKDAGYVIFFNSASLSSKLSWEDIKKSRLFEKANSEANDSLAKRLLNDPASSGVDIKAPFTFFTKQQNQGAYMVFQGKLADVKAFEKTLSEMKEKKPVVKGDGFSYVILNDEGILTWTDKRFLMLGNMNSRGLTGGYSESTKSFGTDSLLIFAKNTYNLSGSKLLDSDSRFAKLIKSEGDVHFWAAAEHTYAEDATTASFNLQRLMKDNISTGTLNFENGKITLHFDQYYNKELESILKKHGKGSITSALTSRLPANAPVAGAAVAPLPAINDIVKMLGLDGTANMLLSQYGMTLENISKAFKGDLAFALSGFEVKKDTIRFGEGNGPNDMYVYEKKDPGYVFAMAIGDQKAYTQLYTTLEQEILKDKPASIQIVNEKDWLIVGNKEADIATFRAAASKPAYAERMHGHQFAIYADLRALLDAFGPAETADEESKKMFALHKNTWETAWMLSDMKDGRYSTDVEINMVNKQVNSLKQLHDYAVQLFPERNPEVYMVPDSTATLTPPPVMEPTEDVKIDVIEKKK